MGRAFAKSETGAWEASGERETAVTPRVAVDASPIIAQMLRLLLNACGQERHELEEAEVVMMAGPDWRTREERLPRHGGRVLVGPVNRSVVLEAMGRGISAFVAFDDEPDHLLEAVRQAATGGSYLSPRIQRRMEPTAADDVEEQKEAIRGVPGIKGASRGGGVLPLLSPREREVAALLAEGCSQEEIREQLFISLSTLNCHTRKIREKLRLGGCSDLRHSLRDALRPPGK